MEKRVADLDPQEKRDHQLPPQLFACLLIVLTLLITTSVVFTPLVSAEPRPQQSRVASASLPNTHPGSSTPAAASVRSGNSNGYPYRAGNPRRPVVDAHTVALYTFDSSSGATVYDALNLRNGTLRGNALIMRPGLFDGTLKSDWGGSYLEASDFSNWDASQGTIEAYIDFGENMDSCAAGWAFDIISMGNGYATNSDVFKLYVNNGLMAKILWNGNWYNVDSGINACRYLSDPSVAAGSLMDPFWGSPVIWPYETWRFHHVAVTWGPRGLEIWVDGILHGVGNNSDNGTYPYRFACNPQDQVGWRDHPNYSYPQCPRPVMVTGGNFPPGDYTGGITQFSKLLIGCGSAGSCFHGRIDEVRISSVQRTFDQYVDPPSTPFPTPTAVSVSQPFVPDPITLGLYHLTDSYRVGFFGYTRNEVTGIYDGGLDGNAVITTTGRFGPGLALDGIPNGRDGQPSIMSLSPTVVPLKSTGTFEAWVNLSPDGVGDQPIFVAGDLGDGLFLGLHSSLRNLAFGVWNGTQWVWNDISAIPYDIAGGWHHVAGVWKSDELQVWLDGNLCNTLTLSGGFPSLAKYVGIGCDRSGHCMRGTVDEVRISNNVRTFSPLNAASRRAPRSTTDGPSLLYFLPFIGSYPPLRFPCSPLW